MRRTLILPVGMVLVLLACGGQGESPWYDGDLTSALEEAAASDRMVLVAFTTDWCVWCRRLETDTLGDPEVRAALADFVPVKVDAEGDGAELARRHRVDSYPTIVFLDRQGEEVERILGFLPPDRFRAELAQVRAGNTFFSCLKRLSSDPGDADALRRTVEGLLERSDVEGAIARLESFQAAGGAAEELCDELMFRARAELQTLVYERAARLYREGWPRRPSAPDLPTLAGLQRVVASLDALPREQQRAALREARLADARRLLEEVDIDRLGARALLEAGRFAVDNGLYGAAATAYARWYRAAGAAATVDELNQVAWDLYLTGREPELAIAAARAAATASDDPDVADTLARLLYANGDARAALELAERAVAAARSPSDRRLFDQVRQRMEDAAPLGDRPPFDLWPGLPDEVL